jgi:outer membrane receptor protein involved in Fe transport
MSHGGIEMRRVKRGVQLLLMSVVVLWAAGTVWGASKGKISGRVVDQQTGEPLPGCNILVLGTTLGAATDEDGYYFIINVPPGEYSLKATMIGYATVVQERVRVNIDQTTTVNFSMRQEAVPGETVVVEAKRPVVQLDVSSSQSIVTSEVIKERPLDNFEEILATEVGVDLTASTEGSGLIVRGGGLNETDIVVDGLSTRNLRNQQPLTTLSLTAIKEIELLTGGFSAEYGEIRSGLVNVVTEEGSLNRYSFEMDARISPPARKHFGPSPYGLDGPFWKVYAGPDAFTGVTREMVKSGKYPFEFVGWNKVAEQFLADADPDNDMTPQELLELWKWQHRPIKYGDKPDYVFDGTVSGPIPKTPIAFLLSQRYENLQLVYPFSRKNSIASNTMLKFTTYLSPGTKLSFNNVYILQRGVSGSIYDDTIGMITGTREGTEYAQDVFYWRYIWHDANFNPIETQLYRGGIALNHVLNPKSYFDLRLEYTKFKTRQEPIALRDTTKIKKIGNKWYDEAPFGYVGSQLGMGITEKYDILGDFLMSGGGRGQDHSKYWGIKFTGDFVYQIDVHNQIKTGLAVEYTELNERREVNHSQTTQPFEEAPWYWWYYDAYPVKASAYAQDKLEYSGMIANFGLRVDYFNPGKRPYNLDPNFIFKELPYTLQNFRAYNNSFRGFETSESSYKLYWSPRLGISHPVTSSSKIFFNYGHFYQPPVMDQLYTVQPSAQQVILPNLKAEWPKTVAYEIGIENAFREFLIRFMGYYKDVTNELSQQNIVSFDRENNVATYANNSYSDIRGLELKVERRVGRWWYGWVGVEYMVRSRGYTGLRYIYENRQLAKQQRERTTQERNWPVPSVKANLTFRTPADFGPRFLGIRPLGDWRLNILQEWSDGGKELLNPEAILSEQHYVDVIDYWNTDMLLEKRIQMRDMRIGLYMQIRNLFNYKGFPNPLYWNKYVDSLHFPWETGSQKGNDKLGEYRKDYIDLGWNTWQHFVNPRDIWFGVRIEF